MKNNIITIGQAKLSEVEISNVTVPKAGIINRLIKLPATDLIKNELMGHVQKLSASSLTQH